MMKDNRSPFASLLRQAELELKIHANNRRIAALKDACPSRALTVRTASGTHYQLHDSEPVRGFLKNRGKAIAYRVHNPAICWSCRIRRK